MKRLLVCIVLLATAPAALAEPRPIDRITVEDPWARALPPVSENGAAYLTIVNRSHRPTRLIGASSPISERVEIHAHQMSGGMMQMRHLDSVDLPADSRVRFAPHGLHLMLMGLRHPLRAGEHFSIRLEFLSAPTVVIEVPIR